jgi:hypothetical protein
VLSRAPVAGATKTRLSPPLTPAQARDFHVACLNDLLEAGRAWRAARRRAGGAEVTLHLFITPPASQPAFRLAGVRWPDDWALHNQRGGTLGARMEHALRTVLGASRQPAWALLVGADLPLLGPPQLEQATAALERAEVVFGPTPDGGYYLVATRVDPAGLFDLGGTGPADAGGDAGRGWGGASVLEASLAAARARGRTVAQIAPLPDADTAKDLRAILAHPLASSLAERESLRFLRRLLGEDAAPSTGADAPRPDGSDRKDSG